MVGGFPLWVYDWSFAYFHDAVARTKTGRDCRIHKFDVRPLILVIMDIVRDFAEQYSFWPEDAVCLADERRV
jgi:hypothetical protein